MHLFSHHTIAWGKQLEHTYAGFRTFTGLTFQALDCGTLQPYDFKDNPQDFMVESQRFGTLDDVITVIILRKPEPWLTFSEAGADTTDPFPLRS